MRAIERVALTKVSLSGALAGTLIAGFEFLLREMLGVDLDADD